MFKNNGIFKKSQTRKPGISNILAMCEHLGDVLFSYFGPGPTSISEPNPEFASQKELALDKAIYSSAIKNLILLLRNALLMNNYGHNLKAMESITASV